MGLKSIKKALTKDHQEALAMSPSLASLLRRGLALGSQSIPQEWPAAALALACCDNDDAARAALAGRPSKANRPAHRSRVVGYDMTAWG
jgi:hypothetical protein